MPSVLRFQGGDGALLGLLPLLAAALCGLAAAPVWSVPAAALALASISYARHHALFRRAADLSLQDAVDQTLLRSLANGLVASAAAYGCGAAFRFLALGWQ
jgi:hypothetical protein